MNHDELEWGEHESFLPRSKEEQEKNSIKVRKFRMRKFAMILLFT